MVNDDENAEPIKQLLDTPDLAGALESERFKQFLDHVPVAIAVSELKPAERILYANIEFERLTGKAAAEVVGRFWDVLRGSSGVSGDALRLSDAITDEQDFLGTFSIEGDGAETSLDVWSNVIEDDEDTPVYRLVAFVETSRSASEDHGSLEQLVRNKDVLLRELQHRVKNNLQMITALIRLEARNLPDDTTGARFDRLAGRVEALALLYNSLAHDRQDQAVDLGVYLSQIASAVMRAHAVEGIHLDLQIDTWPVSINVAMPAGLVVNEVLTNTLKHAFEGRGHGTITLHSLVDAKGCQVIVADDGIGLAEGARWPRPGKLSALIVQSLRQNAKAEIDVESTPGNGMRVTIFFARVDAAPAAPG